MVSLPAESLPYVDLDERLTYGRPPLELVQSPPATAPRAPAANVPPTGDLRDLLFDSSEEGRERWTQFMEYWGQEAANEIRQLAAFVRQHGARNFVEVLERVDGAARAIEQASQQAAESEKAAAAIARQLRKDAQQYVQTLPEMVSQFFDQAEKADRQAARMRRQFEAYSPVLNAYRDALQVLVTMRDESILESCTAATLESIKWGEDDGDI